MWLSRLKSIQNLTFRRPRFVHSAERAVICTNLGLWKVRFLHTFESGEPHRGPMVLEIGSGPPKVGMPELFGFHKKIVRRHLVA
jgi:hypothetical protein